MTGAKGHLLPFHSMSIAAIESEEGADLLHEVTVNLPLFSKWLIYSSSFSGLALDVVPDSSFYLMNRIRSIRKFCQSYLSKCSQNQMPSATSMATLWSKPPSLPTLWQWPPRWLPAPTHPPPPVCSPTIAGVVLFKVKSGYVALLFRTFPWNPGHAEQKPKAF